MAWLTQKRVLVIGLGFLLGQFLFLLLLASGETGSTAGLDFWQHYFAAQAIRAGHPEEIRAWPGTLPYPYPYFVPLLLIPLSFLPPALALGVWIICLYLVAGGACYFFARHFFATRQGETLLFVTLALVWPPAFMAFFDGQITPLLLGILALAFWLYRREQEWLSGFVLSLALIKPHLIAGLLAAALFNKKGRVILGFLLGLLPLLALSLLAGQMRSGADWEDYLFSWFFNNPRSVSLVGRLWFLPWQVQAMASLVGWAALAIWWWRQKAISIEQAALGYVLFLAFSPYLLVYDLMLLIPILALLARRPNRWLWAFALLSSLSLFAPRPDVELLPSLLPGIGEALGERIRDLVALSLILLAMAIKARVGSLSPGPAATSAGSGR